MWPAFARERTEAHDSEATRLLCRDKIDKLLLRMHIEFSVDRFPMGSHGVFGKLKLLGYRGIAHVPRQQFHNRLFALGDRMTPCQSFATERKLIFVHRNDNR